MKKSTNRSSLILMELIIVILFFSVASAICMSIFADASALTKLSDDISNAVLVAQSAAECYKSADGDINKTAGILGGAAGGDTVTLGYTEDWKRGGQAYEMILKVVSPGTANVTVARSSGEELFSLTVKNPGGDKR